MQNWQQLLIVPALPPKTARRLSQTHSGARVVFWDGDPLFAAMLAAAVGLAPECFVFDDWMGRPEFAAGGDNKTKPLSEFDPMLTSEARAAARNSRPGPARPILFCPSSDTHCRMFEPVSRLLKGSLFLDFKGHEPHERVAETLRALGLDAIEGRVEALDRVRPCVIVLGNDWNRDSTALIDAAWARRIPSVCVQEGCLNFADPLGRMQRCNVPFIQGPEMLSHLPHEGYYLTGNPRFDALAPLPPPAAPCAMLNSNFTYGVHESARENWVRGAANACRAAGLDFFISQHPRDRGQFPQYRVEPSGPLAVAGHLRQCSVLVTRFSTLIYEALLMGRPCIYYNPHGEDPGIFAELPGGRLSLARDEAELTAALRGHAAADAPSAQPALVAWLDRHCGPRDGRAAARVASALKHFAACRSPLPWEPLRRPLCLEGQRQHRRLPAPLSRLYRQLRGLPPL